MKDIFKCRCQDDICSCGEPSLEEMKSEIRRQAAQITALKEIAIEAEAKANFFLKDSTDFRHVKKIQSAASYARLIWNDEDFYESNIPEETKRKYISKARQQLTSEHPEAFQ